MYFSQLIHGIKTNKPNLIYFCNIEIAHHSNLLNICDAEILDILQKSNICRSIIGMSAIYDSYELFINDWRYL